jgi:hypothetical protein
MNHYFIGKLLNPEDSKKLLKSQNYISKNVPITNKIYNFNTKFAYLGYMDEQTMLELQNKISNVLEAISDNFGPQNCTYTRYGITGLKTTKKSIAALYDSNNLSNIIVPYLRSYIDKITGDNSDFYPHISLLRIDANNVNKVLLEDESGKNILQKTFLPDPNSFLIDSIDIMKGELMTKRTGLPSRYDDMNIKKISSYKLRGNN